MTKNSVKDSWPIIAGIALLASVATLIVIIAIGPCTGLIEKADGTTMPMKCHWAVISCKYTVILAVLTGAIQLFLKSVDGRLGSSVILIVIAAITFLLTTNSVGIGHCSTSILECDMTCCKETLYLRIFLGIMVVIGVIQLFFAKPRVKKEKSHF